MHWYAFLAQLSPAFWEFFRINWRIFDMQIKVEEKGSSNHAGIKNISGEVSIFWLWANWVHFVTCSKIE